jgi:flagellar biosynthetic protein FlhB
VKSSRVVITNPTHFAVALKYKEDDDDAPILVAKGADYMAKQIRVLAEKYKVPIHENPPLARSLYKEVDEGQIIPPDMYMAVAEVIAFVERLENMSSGGRPFGS